MKPIAAALILTLAIAGPAWAGGAEHLQQGETEMHRGRYEQALASFTRAIDSPDLKGSLYAIAFIKRGEAYAALRRYNDAIRDYDRVIEFNPKNPLGYNYRGYVLLEAKRYDEAIRDFTRAITLDPKFVNAWNNRAMAGVAKGEIGRPLEDLRRAILADPDNPVAYYYRGNLYFYQGNYVAAAADFARHAELAPGELYTAIKLYLTLTRSGEDGLGALRKLAPGIKTQGWPSSVLDMYLGRSTPESVLAQLPTTNDDAARERACEIYFYVAYHYLIAGDRARAKSLFEKAVATNVLDFNEYRIAKAELWRLQG